MVWARSTASVDLPASGVASTCPVPARLGGVRQPELSLPAQHLDSQLSYQLIETASARTTSQSPDTSLELRGQAPARAVRHRLLSGSCSSARSFDPRFLPTLGHPHAVALHFAHRNQFTTGRSPISVRPCWAHTQNGRPEIPDARDGIESCRQGSEFPSPPVAPP